MSFNSLTKLFLSQNYFFELNMYFVFCFPHQYLKHALEGGLIRINTLIKIWQLIPSALSY